MSNQKIVEQSLPFVTATLNYLAPTRDKPRTYAFDRLRRESIELRSLVFHRA